MKSLGGRSAELRQQQRHIREKLRAAEKGRQAAREAAEDHAKRIAEMIATIRFVALTLDLLSQTHCLHVSGRSSLLARS